MTVVIAHRGASGYLPEHTLAAKRLAYEMGSTVRWTADVFGEPTDGLGLGEKAALERLAERMFRAGEKATLGRFELLEKLGAGGMGEVLAAYDPKLDRRVAIKLISPRWARVGTATGMLRREARAMAQVAHPNVVQIFDAGFYEGHAWLAMELVEGPNLVEGRRVEKVCDILGSLKLCRARVTKEDLRVR